MAKKNSTRLTLRITDQETARVVAFHDARGRIVGAGCLVNSQTVITCKHVVRFALGRRKPLKADAVVPMTLIGVVGNPKCLGEVVHFSDEEGPENDLCLLKIKDLPGVLMITPVEFIAPLRHGRKSFSVLGFPDSDPQGRNSIGILQAADAKGLVQMESEGALLVKGGFSGAPVWSPDLGGFVGVVVTELNEQKVAWCIPSRTIAAFNPELRVRFRIPESDRPRIHDYGEDDPNLLLFGPVSENATRRLTARIRTAGSHFRVDLKYETLDRNRTIRGGYVTFVMHPSFTSEEEDAYELFSLLDESGVAENHFWCIESFTVAAIGDAGDTSLTLDLGKVRPRPRGFR
jgi:Trypsin-like peptidase domain